MTQSPIAATPTVWAPPTGRYRFERSVAPSNDSGFTVEAVDGVVTTVSVTDAAGGEQ